MQAFQFENLATRVRFGSGSLLHLREEVARLGATRVIVLTTPQQISLADRAEHLLGDVAVARFTDAAMHTPQAVTQLALERVREAGVDGIVSLGGGSTIGLGKAIALRTGLPHITVPTTYAGSEMTPILGETDAGRKVTQRQPVIQPRAVLYDVDLTLSLPIAASVTSGLNAIAHAVEALYAAEGNPITSMLAEAGIRSFAQALPRLHTDPADRDAREQALYGAWLCGTCLGQVGMALHHKLCHTLGGTFGLPHAETHSVVLPHAIAYNAVASVAMDRIARALGTDQAPALALFELGQQLGAPAALRDLGMPEAGIAQAADLAAANPYPNPRPIERDALEALLRRAWAGSPPLA
ncbi:maleylacetate reductase [Novosphingobium lentum]|uniref:maleylacetate reductase n=1 Tax=Novosphingobium lentum TaxID=145287 RepID=UPI000B08AFDF|nr:maleylacetate reductase [Novosphingobium lentum]